MNLFENIGGALTEGAGGLAIAVGTVVVAPMLIPALRPAAKQLIKGGIMLSDQVRVWAAESGEQWNDLVAEARAELKDGTVTVETPPGS